MCPSISMYCYCFVMSVASSELTGSVCNVTLSIVLLRPAVMKVLSGLADLLRFLPICRI